ncbi:aspartate-semialdehyde dehydrogenase [Laetiporus sulphureus 93-53]|uniref:aspartate-semialdehyde dehydrogenase n=1 Tax=Laetiporus sulphureus 93-53 TaxID=1314785 RepID=A0A165C3P9_9APHY|nr:aspartate-semialdehyde dehydrogenase [Laetiporus sulphureus 93-53]KZT02152.1 aspartate-semialdehyde dehydrogenase [Laetiporus sulphureus 93-53]
MHDARKIKVSVLGATGTIGQRFISLLSEHPFFALHALGASHRSAGKPYSHAVTWKQTRPIPSVVRDMVVEECKPECFAECEVIFSGLDADVAGPNRRLEAFRSAEFAVFSNAKCHRRDPNVPLVVPLVHSSHFAMIPQQRALHSPPLQKGFIVTNANCSTTGVVVPLAALERAFGPIDFDILDNVVPYIGGEEEKMEWETLKILGGISESDDGVRSFDMRARHPLRISAQCNRVPVIEGHTECMSVRFVRRLPPSPQQVREALVSFTSDAWTASCPSAPRHTIFVHEEPDRPQPRLDCDYQAGAGISVGHVRQCQVLDIKFVVLANNVTIGAATSSIINAELAVSEGII